MKNIDPKLKSFIKTQISKRDFNNLLNGKDVNGIPNEEYIDYWKNIFNFFISK